VVGLRVGGRGLGGDGLLTGGLGAGLLTGGRGAGLLAGGLGAGLRAGGLIIRYYIKFLPSHWSAPTLF
jgi:hypothetical protein